MGNCSTKPIAHSHTGVWRNRHICRKIQVGNALTDGKRVAAMCDTANIDVL
jgi:hypothetical protein